MEAQGNSNSQSRNESRFVFPARRRSVPLLLVVVAGIVVSLTVFSLVYHWETYDETQRMRSQFRLDAQALVGAIRRELDTHLQVLQSLGALFQASEQVTREEFRVFANQLIEAVPSIQALEWIPRVEHSQRSGFVAQARPAIPGFRISQRDENGALVAAPDRDEYFPVLFIEPYSGNETALGLDLASETVRREALHRARDTGQMTLTGPITLVQETESQKALLAYRPIYRKGAPLESPTQRRHYLEGFVLLVCRVRDLIEYAIARSLREGIDVWVFDATVAPGAALLHFYSGTASWGGGPRSPADTAMRSEDGFEVGGRRWEIVAAPVPGSFALPVAYSAWLVLAAGLLITGIVGRYLRAQQRYSLEMEQASRALDREVAGHRQTGTALKESDARFLQILESAADAILISDDRGRIQTVNRQAERLFGYDRQELIGQSVELLLPERLREKHAAFRRAYHADPRQRPITGNQELTGQRKDGTQVPLEISLTPTGQNEQRMVTAIIRDISVRKEAEAELRRLNRTHSVLSICNNSLARSIDEAGLLNAFCANLVMVGGYRFAWVGYAQRNSAKDVRMMAYAGHDDAGLSLTDVSWSDRDGKIAACGTVIQTGRPVVLRDIERKPNLTPWHKAALRLGYRSMIALPLQSDAHAFGNFSIFAAEEDAFNDNEVTLLTELAEDLSFGIETLRARMAHERKVRLLREEVERDTRKRIAAALHDGVAQSVQAVNLGLKRLRALAVGGQPLQADLLHRIIDDVGGIIGELREVSHELRPLFLERRGLHEAIRYYCSEIGERAGIEIRVLAPELPEDLSARVREQCFLSFREAVTNAIKHADASRIDVVLESPAPDAFTLRIVDDGVGFDTAQVFGSPTGLGLSMIRERAESIGGSAQIISAPGKGTAVTITVTLVQDLALGYGGSGPDNRSVESQPPNHGYSNRS